MAGQGLKYNVDIVMCIDTTGSMGGLLDTVKLNALKFYPDLKSACEAKDKNIDQLRIKVIDFKDYNADGADGMRETEFFNIPEQEDKFKAYVNALTPNGGGDEPENGLEAISLAMNSDWTTGGDKRRHIIIIWTDASAHPLESSLTKNSFYPAGMPADFNEFTDWWEDEQGGKMNKSAKRLLIFAPDAAPWTEMGLSFDKAIHHTAKAGEGLTDVDYQTILNSIVQTI
ncbi:MAG: VWA domain-containing protein [Treponema sp.]|nr:VWA domain-containing protein [Clostridia bacterium]MBP3607584.1 VWA domain-containing protein [Treponema sp.]